MGLVVSSENIEVSWWTLHNQCMKQKFRGSILPRFQLPISLCSLYILVFPSAEDFLMGSPFLLFLGFFPESVPLYLIPWPSTIPRCMAKLVNQVHPDWMPTLHTRGHQIGLFPEHKRTSDQELLCNCFLSSLPAPGTCFFTLPLFCCLCSVLCDHVITNSALTQ